MDSEYDRAVEKVRDEMAATKDQTVIMVGEMVTMLLGQRRELAGAILAEGKSLRGIYDEMYKEAKANKKGNSACIAPQDAVRIALKYYGADPDDAPALFGGTHDRARPVDGLDLDALLGDM